jgi:ParB family transcriptional regulator, chromosome partitioning protein
MSTRSTPVANEKPTRRLGRGLDALLRGPSGRESLPQTPTSGLQNLQITSIRNNPYQPRKRFATNELRELEESIKANGLLQPITVRKAITGEGYELVAGERRLRAASQLGWKDIPAIVRHVDDQALLTYALIENLQRADLDPVEEAEGYARLVQEFGLTQQAVADLVGKERATVANSLRVLNLPSEVREMLRDGRLTLGHAKALLGASSEDKMTRLAREIVLRGLTVREVERRLRDESKRSKLPKGSTRPARPTSAIITDVESKLRRRFQTDVQISITPKGSGSLSLQFYSETDLERIVDLMGIKVD